MHFLLIFLPFPFCPFIHLARDWYSWLYHDWLGCLECWRHILLVIYLSRHLDLRRCLSLLFCSYIWVSVSQATYFSLELKFILLLGCKSLILVRLEVNLLRAPIDRLELVWVLITRSISCASSPFMLWLHSFTSCNDNTVLVLMPIVTRCSLLRGTSTSPSGLVSIISGDCCPIQTSSGQTHIREWFLLP